MFNPEIKLLKILLIIHTQPNGKDFFFFKELHCLRQRKMI